MLLPIVISAIIVVGVLIAISQHFSRKWHAKSVRDREETLAILARMRAEETAKRERAQEAIRNSLGGQLAVVAKAKQEEEKLAAKAVAEAIRNKEIAAIRNWLLAVRTSIIHDIKRGELPQGVFVPDHIAQLLTFEMVKYNTIERYGALSRTKHYDTLDKEFFEWAYDQVMVATFVRNKDTENRWLAVVRASNRADS